MINSDSNIKYLKYERKFLKRKGVCYVLGQNYILTPEKRKRLYDVFNAYGYINCLGDRVSSLANMIKYNVTNYVGRIRRLQKLPASPSKYYYVLVFGKKHYLKFFNNTTDKRTAHFKNKINFWIKNGFTVDGAEEKVKEIQRIRAKKAGDKLKNTRMFSIRCSEYWIRMGLSRESAKEKVKQIQSTFSLNKCIKLYGEKNGYIRWHNRQVKWQNTLKNKTDNEKQIINSKKSISIKSYLLKGYTLEEAETKVYSIFKKRNNYSNSSQDLFKNLDIALNECQLHNTYYKTKNHEKMFFTKTVDFYDSISGVVIEFYGDFWHRNPKIYKKDFTCYNISSDIVWENDKKRLQIISNHTDVSDIIIIWESEFLKNKQETIEKLASYIKGKRNEPCMDK